ncbi:MAG: hypothetical protein ACHP8A_10785 [Terriglobales bacterium]
MRFASVSLTSATMFVALTLVACNSSPNQSAVSSSMPTIHDAKAPLPSDQFKVRMVLQGSPVISVDGKFIVVTVDLSNDGSAILETKGINPINLGAHSINADGSLVNNDLARGALPAPIAPNSHAFVSINLPVDKTIGYSAQILPVQENVGWFDEWGTKPLVVGPFNVCSAVARNKICDASGKALLSQQ